MIKNLLKRITTLTRFNYKLLSRLPNSIDQSKYYIPRINVQQFFNTHQLEYRTSGSTHKLKQCPFCIKPHNNDITNLYTLNVNKENGVFYCFRCTAKGSWLDFKRSILGVKDQQFNPFYNNNECGHTHIVEGSKISSVEYFIHYQRLKKQQYKDIEEYLISRGFNQLTIQAYKIGAGVQSFYNEDGEFVDIRVIYFPMFRLLSEKELERKENQKDKQMSEQIKENGQIQRNSSSSLNNIFDSDMVELVKVKIRGSGSKNKKYMKQSPMGHQSGFFGLNLIKKTDKTIVLTEGEFDAMSVYQMTNIPALSLPHGASNLPDSILPYLDQFQKIILWMDNDQAGRFGQEKIAYKLGLSRTFIVKNLHNKYKDANDYLQHNPQEIQLLINKAKTIPDQNVLTFSILRQNIKNKIFKFQQQIGFQLNWFKFFNRKVKGLRTSQLSIVSGPTGSGKTTFLSQLSVQLCSKGIPVLWGSFEVRNQVLITNMLMQYSKINLNRQKTKFDYYADQFSNLPMYYLSFYGSSDVDKVIGTIQYAIQKYNISLVIIDTLQFLLSNQAEGFKKFDLQDQVMSRLRSISTNYDIHLIVVIHPRKTQDNQDIGIHSIYGTSKATQEADNIWIIQQRQGFKIFDIKKNRFDGEVGRSALAFNKTVKSFFELKRNQLESIFKKEKTIDDIILQRQQEMADHHEEGQYDESFLSRNNSNNKRKNQ